MAVFRSLVKFLKAELQVGGDEFDCEDVATRIIEQVCAIPPGFEFGTRALKLVPRFDSPMFLLLIGADRSVRVCWYALCSDDFKKHGPGKDCREVMPLVIRTETEDLNDAEVTQRGSTTIDYSLMYSGGNPGAPKLAMQQIDIDPGNIPGRFVQLQ